jgi:hypothetical protein
MAMINPETPTGGLLRKMTKLLKTVAEAAWTSDIPPPARLDFHRFRTEAAYLAQCVIFDMLPTAARPTPSQTSWNGARDRKLMERPLACVAARPFAPTTGDHPPDRQRGDVTAGEWART